MVGRLFCVLFDVEAIPPQDPSWVPGTLGTEYTAKYVEKAALRDPAHPKLPYIPSPGKFMDMTTQRADFTPKRVMGGSGKRPGDSMPKVPFTGNTTYQAFHDGKRGPPSAPLKNLSESYSGPFFGATSNKADYVDWMTAPLTARAPTYDLLHIPFEGNSTYRADFEKKNPLPRDLREKPPILQSSPMVNYTTYGVDFVPKPMGGKGFRICCDNFTHSAIHSGRLSMTQPCCDNCANGKGSC
ncbi:hypothetical protein CEUSTIGMA_g9828.t1 [Chlamydomonas eustigma]|uniref:Uncharacterized protein n=1 Tax=Chlamydomonas eustigma TaxID=1157962 RepID=A0A250XHX1_9CHLO|nr:hypothetical protein CEUSTIGMA_g9828.t1 [Chlamydomonas eustigma]|eukprot:GAX82400.1 hypothetical protein CEUSTIGMA_g9828.t1 [Chlamydomonas eustigma]